MASKIIKVHFFKRDATAKISNNAFAENATTLLTWCVIFGASLKLAYFTRDWSHEPL